VHPHAPHERVLIRVDRQHGVALMQLTCGLIGPDIPEACESPRCNEKQVKMSLSAESCRVSEELGLND
jgi:hypothetical protein